MSLQVVATVYTPSGDQLAQRVQYVTLRVFAQPPYSAIAGREDGSADVPAGAATPAHEGDVGGGTVAGDTAAEPSPSPYPAGWTVLHVVYSCTNGSGAGGIYACSNAAPPDPDGALLHDTTWTNGNQPGSQ